MLGESLLFAEFFDFVDGPVSDLFLLGVPGELFMEESYFCLTDFRPLKAKFVELSS